MTQDEHAKGDAIRRIASKQDQSKIIETWSVMDMGQVNGGPLLTVEGYDDHMKACIRFSISIPDLEDLVHVVSRTITMLYGKSLGRFMGDAEYNSIGDRLWQQRREIALLRNALEIYGNEKNWDKEGKFVHSLKEDKMDKGEYARKILGSVEHLQ